MVENEVLGNEPQQPREPEGQGNDKVTISKSELEGLQRELRESRQSVLDWASVARRGAEPQQEQAAEADDFNAADFDDPDLPGLPEGDTPEKLVKDIAEKGLGALRDRGFVSAKEAHRIAVEAASRVSRDMIGKERQKITTDAQIFAEFPELKDQNSPLFKETSALFKQAVAMDKGAMKTPSALYLSARAAKESLNAKAAASKRGNRGEGDDSQEDEAEAEEDRQQRSRSQDSRPRGRQEIVDDDMIGPEAKILMRAFGVTEAEYKEQKKAVAGGRRR